MMLEIPTYGRCQCGECKYQVFDKPYVSYTCHCIECQRLSSSAFNTCAQFPAEKVKVVKGDPCMRDRVADSGNVLTTWFCGGCGSALYTQNSARPRIRTVYVGTLDQRLLVEVNAHIWLSQKLSWVLIPRDHRKFMQGGDWSSDYVNDIERYKP